MSKKVLKASADGNLRVLESLLEKKPDHLNACNQKGYTPLSSALENEQEEVVDYLLGMKADVNLGRRGVSPLQCALRTGNTLLVKKLLACKADPNTRDENDWTLAHGLIAYDTENSLRMLKYLLKESDFDPSAQILATGQTLLHFAVEYERPECVRVILASGDNAEDFDPDAKDENGMSPLLLAAETKQLDALLGLLEGGADPNSETPDAQNVAHFVYKQFPDLTGPFHDLLRKFKVNLEAKDHDGNTPEDLAEAERRKFHRKRKYELERDDIAATLRQEREIARREDVLESLDPALAIWIQEKNLEDFREFLAKRGWTLDGLRKMTPKKLKSTLKSASPIRRMYFCQCHKILLQEIADEEAKHLRTGTNLSNWLRSNGFAHLEPIFAKRKITWRRFGLLGAEYIRNAVPEGDQARFLEALEAERRRRVRSDDPCPEEPGEARGNSPGGRHAARVPRRRGERPLNALTDEEIRSTGKWILGLVCVLGIISVTVFVLLADHSQVKSEL